MNFTLLRHCIIPNEIINTETKQQLQLRKNPLISEEKRKPINKNFKLLKNPDPIEIKAYLTSLELKNGTARFFNLDEPDNDYFYKILKTKANFHKKINPDKKYYEPFNITEFKFKISNKTMITDKDGNFCILDELNNLINKPCLFLLKILPYELDNLNGLIIRVSNIKQIP